MLYKKILMTIWSKISPFPTVLQTYHLPIMSFPYLTNKLNIPDPEINHKTKHLTGTLNKFPIQIAKSGDHMKGLIILKMIKTLQIKKR